MQANTISGTSADDAQLHRLAIQVGQHLLASSRRLVTAESCTGGWIGKALTDVAGSSSWFAGGAIAYSNELKQRLLGVDAAILASHGAVSEATVRAMAEGAIAGLGGELAVAVSGIAGPDGGTLEKPVGTIWLAWTCVKNGRRETTTHHQIFPGDREAVRRQTVACALERILKL